MMPTYREWRMVMTRHGLHSLRGGGRAYTRINASSEAQARRWVAEEEREGFRSWVESREVTPWKRVP